MEPKMRNSPNMITVGIVNIAECTRNTVNYRPAMPQPMPCITAPTHLIPLPILHSVLPV